jgi:hypothetical protein
VFADYVVKEVGLRRVIYYGGFYNGVIHQQLSEEDQVSPPPSIPSTILIV